MSASTILRRFRFIRRILLLTAIGASTAEATQPSESGSDPEVLSLTKASDGEHIVLHVTIQRPKDMGTMTIEKRRLWWDTHHTVWPRAASLSGDPRWKYPCYPEYPHLEPRRSFPFPRQDRLTFICRCPAAKSPELFFRYPTSDGGWREVPLVLDLASADALRDQPSPRKRWAAAQALWFRRLREYVGDVGGFLAYAAQQTHRKFDVQVSVERDWGIGRFRRPEELEYAVLSGALAIQESLQLDRMVNTDRDRGERKTSFGDIPAVGVKSHPFDEMREGKSPVHGKLAAFVPEDHYFLRFRSVARLLELLDFTEQWGNSLLRLARPVGTDHGTRERTLRQLCLPDNILARMLGPAVIKEIAVSGSDPYIVNGSDITVLFHAQTKEAFQAAVDLPFLQAKQMHDDARHDEVTHQGITIERLVSSDRRVSCHRCWIDGVCMYSNSLVALKRTIDAAKGTLPSLAKAADFKYMRAAVFPIDESLEHGFLYLSDPFIRRLVGAEVRIKQKRRLEAATSLKMLTNAAAFYGYQHGPSKPTFEQLVADRSMNADDLYDPEGGVITWNAERGVARSSTYGDLGFLTPLIEFDSEMATEEETAAYGRFRDRYQQYWRQYFDPIGVRIKLDKTITLETYILPLIDSSRYNELVDVAGGEPISVSTSRFGQNTLLRYVMHLNDGAHKARWATTLGAFTQTNVTSDWLGDWITFWVEDTDAFSTLVRHQYDSMDETQDRRRPGQKVIDVFNASIVLGVHARNKLSLAAFLVALKTTVNTMAPNTVVFSNLEPYHNITIVQIAPNPTSPFAEEFQSDEPESDTPAEDVKATVSERGPALYYATIDDGFYVSTQASALRNLIDRLRGSAEAGTRKLQGVKANATLYVAPRAAELARSTVSYFLEQQARRVSWRNLAQVWLLGRCGLLEDRTLDDAARTYLGYKLLCPDGGIYKYDTNTDSAICSFHGPLRRPLRLDAPSPTSPLGQLLQTIEVVTVRLRFTEDGLGTQVDISRQ
ncbi:MAG: hypothetical protein JSU86_12255 [Phycisphaerales bacterium]|nr:MAG: hypothetical protein JSU86_12255 [Phycisphaerales bacterium]